MRWGIHELKQDADIYITDYIVYHNIYFTHICER